MTAYSASPESLDERFIQILIEELGDRELPPPDVPQHHPSRPQSRRDPEQEADEPVQLLDADEPHLQIVTGTAKPAPAGPTGRWHLQVIEADGREQTIELAGQPISIGRSRRNTVVVRCQRVSRRHLRIWTEGEALWVEEVSDHHRMSVNGAPMPRSWLQPDDEIEVGSVRILVTREDCEAASPDVPPVK